MFPYHRASHILIGLPNRYVPERDFNDPAWDAETRKAADLLEGVNDAVLMSSRNGTDFERPVPGFGLADTNPIYGNEIARLVDWGASRKLGGRVVRLRVRLKDADLYSFRFTSGDATE